MRNLCDLSQLQPCKNWPKYLWLPPVELYSRLAEARLSPDVNKTVLQSSKLIVHCSLASLGLYLIQLYS